MADPVESFKASLEANGISVSEWARANGFKIRTVRAVLYGQVKGKRGVSHKIAVAVGIKKQPKKIIALP